MVKTHTRRSPSSDLPVSAGASNPGFCWSQFRFWMRIKYELTNMNVKNSKVWRVPTLNCNYCKYQLYMYILHRHVPYTWHTLFNRVDHRCRQSYRFGPSDVGRFSRGKSACVNIRWCWARVFQLCKGGKDHMSNQTGKRENHHLKSAFQKGDVWWFLGLQDESPCWILACCEVMRK